MCNAYNHSYDCPCAFGPGNGGGWRGRRFIISSYEPISAGWAKDNGGTVASYVNSNAHCPVCGEPVYFYRSPYDGRVFFDELGKPWPKHGCTDTSQEPRRATRDSVSTHVVRPEPLWRKEGWEPLLSSKVYSKKGAVVVTGDFRDEFIELEMVARHSIDHDSPIFVRETSNHGLFELNFLQSDPSGTNDQTALAACVARITYNKNRIDQAAL